MIEAAGLADTTLAVDLTAPLPPGTRALRWEVESVRDGLACRTAPRLVLQRPSPGLLRLGSPDELAPPERVLTGDGGNHILISDEECFMSDKTYPQLDAFDGLTGAEICVLHQDGHLVRLTLAELAQWIRTAESIVPASEPFEGVLVRRTSTLEVAVLPEGALIGEWLADYAVMREQAQACARRSH